MQRLEFGQLIDQACSNELSAPSSELNDKNYYANQFKGRCVSQFKYYNSLYFFSNSAKIAATLIKKKLDSGIPKVVFLALIITDQAMVKCGYPFHIQVGNKEYINSLIGIMHNKDLNPNIHKKVLTLIETWGKRFERDHDILPLFSDVYKALLRKGTDFGSGAVAQQPSKPAS